MNTGGHTISAELERVIDAWLLMELRHEGQVDVDDTISIEISESCAAEIAQHPLAYYLESLPRFGPEVGIEVSVNTGKDQS
uniref:Uncharacterized protein n=1 Tax=Brevibacterium sp. Ap13 TaxID=1406197 RepID=U5NZB5_9MICO|nr:hypothetical protein [Brevibacterium sp. Ap13]AGY35389.1 hypothetical protein AP13_p00800 [Brevibacterium sp. Ap13]